MWLKRLKKEKKKKKKKRKRQKALTSFNVTELPFVPQRLSHRLETRLVILLRIPSKTFKSTNLLMTVRLRAKWRLWSLQLGKRKLREHSTIVFSVKRVLSLKQKSPKLRLVNGSLYTITMNGVLKKREGLFQANEVNPIVCVCVCTCVYWMFCVLCDDIYVIVSLTKGF